MMCTKNRVIINKKVLIFAFIIILAETGCSYQNKKNSENTFLFPKELVDFAPYEKNPVFTGTGNNTWDNEIRERGYILKEDSIYKMWYSGHTGNKDASIYLGYATSNDGIHWTRYPENPIFKEYWTEDVQVVKYKEKYFMVAEGENDIAHILTSANGIDWQRLGNLDIRMVNGEPIDSCSYGTPTLWIEDNKWYLFYERGDLGIWLAVSTDHKVWTNMQDDPVIKMGPDAYDVKGVAMDQIIKHNENYYGYYHATPDENWASWNSNVAVSNDLIHWKKYENNPIVEPDTISTNYSSPILVFDGSNYRLYTMHDKVRLFFPKNRK